MTPYSPAQLASVVETLEYINLDRVPEPEHHSNILIAITCVEEVGKMGEEVEKAARVVNSTLNTLEGLIVVTPNNSVLTHAMRHNREAWDKLRKIVFGPWPQSDTDSARNPQ